MSGGSSEYEIQYQRTNLEAIRFLDRFEILSNIGEGSTGCVYVCRMLNVPETHERLAVKSVSKETLNSVQKRRRLEKECYCMSYLCHPNILRLHYVLEDSDRVYLVLPYCEGRDLLRFILANRPYLSQDTVRHLFHQILLAVEYAHRKGIIHRDIKPDNILLSKDHSHVYLADWGFAEKWSDSATLNDKCGTYHYASPEVLFGQSYIGPEIDVWSLGVLLFAMSTGQFPFNGRNRSELEVSILNAPLTFPDHLSKELQHLISSILVRTGSKRPTISTLLDHPWFRSSPVPSISCFGSPGVNQLARDSREPPNSKREVIGSVESRVFSETNSPKSSGTATPQLSNSVSSSTSSSASCTSSIASSRSNSILASPPSGFGSPSRSSSSSSPVGHASTFTDLSSLRSSLAAPPRCVNRRNTFYSLTEDDAEGYNRESQPRSVRDHRQPFGGIVRVGRQAPRSLRSSTLSSTINPRRIFHTPGSPVSPASPPPLSPGSAPTGPIPQSRLQQQHSSSSSPATSSSPSPVASPQTEGYQDMEISEGTHFNSPQHSQFQM